MGDESLGTTCPDSYCLVLDLGRGDRRIALLYSSCHLPAIFCETKRICGQYFASRSGTNPRPRAQTLASGASVSLDHGSLDVHAAVHRVSAESRRAVQLGDLSLDRRHRSDGFDYFSHHSRIFLYGLLGDLAGRIDLRDAWRRMLRAAGKPEPPPDRFAKYPLENKLYHGAIIAAGLSAIITGVFMMSRVRTVFFPRNPYLFSDMTWGMMYVLHGLAGVGLIALSWCTSTSDFARRNSRSRSR